MTERLGHFSDASLTMVDTVSSNASNLPMFPSLSSPKSSPTGGGMPWNSKYSPRTSQFFGEKSRGAYDFGDAVSSSSIKGSAAKEAAVSDSLGHERKALPHHIDTKPYLPAKTSKGPATPMTLKSPKSPKSMTPDSVGLAISPDSSLSPPSGKKKKMHKKKKPAKPVSVNLSLCKYDLIWNCCESMGFKVASEDEECILHWSDLSISNERVMAFKPYQRCNHFPGMTQICRKAHLARNLTHLAQLFPEEYDFAPPTFILPGDFQEFLSQLKGAKPMSRSSTPIRGSEVKSRRLFKSKAWIVKPSAGCQGKGIQLITCPEDADDIDPQQVYVAQRYMDKPLLVDGRKFDLRLYVLVTSCDPLRVFLYREGMARFCTEKYEAPSRKNRNRLYMHLTNYSINKTSESFEANNDNGSKRTWSSVKAVLRDEMGIDVNLLWKRIGDVVAKTLLLIQPRLKHEYDACVQHDLDGHTCFELLGIDVLLDRKCRPWLIEVNHSPSFFTDTPVDFEIKNNLILDTLKLAKLSTLPCKRYRKEAKAGAQERLTRADKKFVSNQAQQQEKRDKRMRQYSAYEVKHLGNFELVFPSPDRVDFEKFAANRMGILPVDTALSAVRKKAARQRKLAAGAGDTDQSDSLIGRKAASAPIRRPVRGGKGEMKIVSRIQPKAASDIEYGGSNDEIVEEEKIENPPTVKKVVKPLIPWSYKPRYVDSKISAMSMKPPLPRPLRSSVSGGSGVVNRVIKPVSKVDFVSQTHSALPGNQDKLSSLLGFRVLHYSAAGKKN